MRSKSHRQTPFPNPPQSQPSGDCQLLPGGGYYRLTNVNSGKVMDVLNQSTANGAAVYQSTWWGGYNQQ